MSKNPHISQQWPGKLHKKIDVFLNGKYLHSTNAYKTCKAAKLGYAWMQGDTSGKLPKTLTAHFSK